MEYNRFYKKLFAPVEQKLGTLDKKSIVAIIGFDAGGPINLSTIGRSKKAPFVTYLSCELAVRNDQEVGSLGRYELMMTCNDENWCRKILTNIAQMSLNEVFDHGHTMDISAWVKPRFRIQGIIFEKFSSIRIESTRCGVLRCHGVTQKELAHAMEYGSRATLTLLKASGIYPNTDVKRKSIL